MTRKKYTSKFKTKVVLDVLKERSSVADLAQQYELASQQIHLWASLKTLNFALLQF